MNREHLSDIAFAARSIAWYLSLRFGIGVAIASLVIMPLFGDMSSHGAMVIAIWLIATLALLAIGIQGMLPSPYNVIERARHRMYRYKVHYGDRKQEIVDFCEKNKMLFHLRDQVVSEFDEENEYVGFVFLSDYMLVKLRF
jgi:hypothetical protein